MTIYQSLVTNDSTGEQYVMEVEASNPHDATRDAVHAAFRELGWHRASGQLAIEKSERSE